MVIVDVQLNDCCGADQTEHVGLESAEHCLGGAGRPLRYHVRLPVERNTFEDAAVGHALVEIYATGELLLDLEVLTVSVAQANLISTEPD